MNFNNNFGSFVDVSKIMVSDRIAVVNCVRFQLTAKGMSRLETKSSTPNVAIFRLLPSEKSFAQHQGKLFKATSKNVKGKTKRSTVYYLSLRGASVKVQRRVFDEVKERNPHFLFHSYESPVNSFGSMIVFNWLDGDFLDTVKLFNRGINPSEVSLIGGIK